MTFAILLAAPFAHAQDEEERTATGNDEVVREIVRGFYLKSNIGSTLYMGLHGVRRPDGAPLLSGVMDLQIGAGGDFIDRERFSAGWEIDLQQGLFNGPRVEDLAVLPPLLEGDIHTFAGLAGVEFSTYVTRRFGIGLRLGGGVMLIPLLMHATEYEEAIVGVWGAPAALHEGPLPLAFGGPTIEYYTKLSHFSVGADVDAAYIIGFDLGITPSGYLKYTF